MKIIFKGKILKDADILKDYKVENGSTMHLVMSKRKFIVFIKASLFFYNFQFF